jgi:hypothetical protein
MTMRATSMDSRSGRHFLTHLVPEPDAPHLINLDCFSSFTTVRFARIAGVF